MKRHKIIQYLKYQIFQECITYIFFITIMMMEISVNKKYGISKTKNSYII